MNNGLKGALQFFKNKESAENIFLLDVKQIHLLKISYVKTTGGWAQTGYAVQLAFLLNDNSKFTIVPTTMNAIEDGTYKVFIDILDKAGVVIVDKFGIYLLLNTNLQGLVDYIDEWERGIHHD